MLGFAPLASLPLAATPVSLFLLPVFVGLPLSPSGITTSRMLEADVEPYIGPAPLFTPRYTPYDGSE